MTAPISKSASEAAAEIEGFYNAASEYTCTCFSEPDSGCSHCRAWTKAYNETITTIQSAIDTERQKDAETIASLTKQVEGLRVEAVDLKGQIIQLRADKMKLAHEVRKYR
jgi:hypothetical protein